MMVDADLDRLLLRGGCSSRPAVITVLAGGVGAARMLAGWCRSSSRRASPPIVNTGDDLVLHGLEISPDLDTVTYTLAGAIDPETGLGPGRRDLAGHGDARPLRRRRLVQPRRPRPRHPPLPHRPARHDGADAHRGHRRDRRRLGARPAAAAGDRRPGADHGDRRRTRARSASRSTSSAASTPSPSTAVRFDGVDAPRPAPGVLDAIADAEVVVIAPSNPIVSIGPVLAVPGVRDAVAARRDRRGRRLADHRRRRAQGSGRRMLRELGHEASVVGVARIYAELAGTLVIDEADADLADAVEAEGVRCVVAPTIMSTPERAAALGRTVLDAVWTRR